MQEKPIFALRFSMHESQRQTRQKTLIDEVKDV
jgi:hypothetical protein